MTIHNETDLLLRDIGFYDEPIIFTSPSRGLRIRINERNPRSEQRQLFISDLDDALCSKVSSWPRNLIVSRNAWPIAMGNLGLLLSSHSGLYGIFRYDALVSSRVIPRDIAIQLGWNVIPVWPSSSSEAMFDDQYFRFE